MLKSCKTNRQVHPDLNPHKLKPINSIAIHAREWFDRINGNSYFSATIQVDGELVASLPFQYGYGDHYIDMACALLHKKQIINTPRQSNGTRKPLYVYCEENSINLYTTKAENCLKRDL